MIDKKQQEIRDWFDKNYRLRGYSYLRPPEAYHVYYELIKPVEHSQWLDVACGPGLLLGVLQERGIEPSGIDISPAAVEMAKEKMPGVDVYTGNAENLPWPDNTFDYISCLGSLERMLDLNKVLDEQKRVAKPGARFVYLVRNSETTTWKIFKKWLGLRNRKGHQDAADLEAWTNRFEKNGFKIIDILPDQWPRMRWHYWKGKRGWHQVFRKVKTSGKKLRKANEFIFILEIGK